MCRNMPRYMQATGKRHATSAAIGLVGKFYATLAAATQQWPQWRPPYAPMNNFVYLCICMFDCGTQCACHAIGHDIGVTVLQCCMPQILAINATFFVLFAAFNEWRKEKQQKKTWFMLENFEYCGRSILLIIYNLYDCEQNNKISLKSEIHSNTNLAKAL